MIRAGIVGGTGYTGVELLRILTGHEKVDIEVVTSRSDCGQKVSTIYPNLSGRVDKFFTEPNVDDLSRCDVVFFATPNGTAMQMAKTLLDRGVKVIDLSADFRLKNVEEWQHWYGMSHASPELIPDAVYGLPEINREKIKSARLVACPGCYPTAVQLGFIPLVEHDLLSSDRLIADVKSGVSGAGRKAELATLMSETGESFKAYAVSGHRHLPEIRQGLANTLGRPIKLTFVPHLTPMIRGIHATLYAHTKIALADLQTLYEQRYANEPFVQVLSAGSHPDTRNVRGSNHCHISLHQPPGEDLIVILSVIDNLVKGASGQAVQNMNLLFGFAEHEGLLTVALYP